jgi:PAS domain S-box-containing protein
VFNLVLILEILLFWACVVSFIHAFIDDGEVDNNGFLYLSFGSPFIAFTVAAIVNKRRKIYRKLNLKSLNKDTEVEMYITNIISLVEDRESPRKRMALEGLLKLHMKTCSKRDSTCVCASLINDYVKEEEPSEKEWYLWVKQILLDSLEKFPKSSRLHILYAYVQREKLKNKFKALFEIMIADENKPTIEEEFSIHRYKNIIEEAIIDSDNKISENKGVNVNIIVDFENKFVDFQTVIGNSVELHLDFWRELLENTPEIQKLQTLGSMITRSVEETNKHFKILTTINPNQVKMLKTFGNFLKDIVNDESEAAKILEKAEYNDRTAVVNKQFLDNDRLKYGENSNTCIITISGALKTLGIISNTNNEITRILGYSKTELLGQNIIYVMPRFLSEIHDGFMRNYFESSDAKVIAIERIVFPLDRNGYIVPCTLMAKILPNLSDGLKLVGFLQEIDKSSNMNKDQEVETEEEEAHYVMYDGNTGIIHGVTSGCRSEYGIHAKLMEGADTGNSEFTIENIFPEISQINLEDLKTMGHVITMLNTSSIGQDYVVENDDSGGSDYGQGEEKEKRYRKAKVKMSLYQDDEYGDFSMKVLKFSEIKEDTESNDQDRADISVKHDDNSRQEKSLMKVDLMDARSGDDLEKSGAMGQPQSEVESGNDLNEEIRDLKEFKAMISEKTIPKSIRILRNAAIIFALVLLGLSILDLCFFSALTNEFKEGTDTISNSFSRHDIIANINYNLRKLQLLAVGTIQPSASATYEANLRAKLISLIDDLRTVTLAIDDEQNTLTSHGFANIESTSVMIETLIQTGTNQDYNFFSDSMSQYTSHSTSASNAAKTSYTTTSVTDSTKADFFYVRRNGLGPLRAQSESNAAAYTNYYVDRTSNYDNRFKIIMIVAIAMIVISEFILIPIVFSVHKTATKVLSLFGYIPIPEIAELSAKCERYVQNYLENHRGQQDYGYDDEEEENDDRPSKTSRMGDRSYVEVNQNPHDAGLSLPHPEEADQNASYLVEMSLEESHRKISGLRIPETQTIKAVNYTTQGALTTQNFRTEPGETKGLMEFSHKTPIKQDHSQMMITSNANLMNNTMKNGSILDAKKIGKEDDKIKGQNQDEDDADLLNDRPQKLLNSKYNNRAKVIAQFCFIGLLFIAYFAIDYVFDRVSLNNIKKGFTQYKLVSQRMPDIRLMTAFTLEVIAEIDPDHVYVYPTLPEKDYRVYYQNITLSDNNDLKNSDEDLPSQFDDYLSLFVAYDGGDICQQYYASDTSSSDYATCAAIAGGLLTRGLTLSVTRITQLSDDLITEFAAKTQDQTGQIAILNGDDFAQTENLLTRVAPVVKALKSQYQESFRTYINFSWTTERIRFAVFVCFVVIAFLILWLPYLKGLQDKIFRTKGMLNMIPMELITKNANLRRLFAQSGDILQAVK